MGNRISKVILSKNINIDKDYNNVLDYTESKMVELCQQNQVVFVQDCSFIRKNGTINVQAPYSLCLQANYMAFTNPDYSNKWFFAWITDVKYISDGNVEIEYQVDAWSTWYDYWKIHKCFIERQHVTDDTVGLHTLNENLEIGQIVSDYTDNLNELGAESFYYIVIGSNYDPSDDTRYAGMGIYAEYPQGSMWFAWLVNRENYATTINEISDWIYDVTVKKHSDDIQAMFSLPYQAFNLIGDIDENTHKVINGKGRKLDDIKKYSKSIIRTFDDYTPKNNKLYCYPYSFVRITNNLGSYNDYKIEDFKSETDDNIEFSIVGIPCIGYSGKIRPKNYQGILYNEDESLQLGKYPTLSWSVDAFTNWLTQNSVNLTVGTITNVLGSALSIGAGIGTGNPLGVASGVISLSSGIANTFGQINQASMLPNTAQGNANSGDVAFSFNINRFKLLHMRPKKEYLERIDNFFTKFGYRISNIELPNIKGRPYWNYIEIGQGETIGNPSNGTKSTPANYMETINNACRKGVTIWHNHVNIGNYDLNNN